MFFIYRLIDLARRTEILKWYNFYQAFSGSQESLAEMQKSNLSKFMLSILRDNKFYAEYLKDFGEEEISQNPYQVISQLPLMDKETLRVNSRRIHQKVKGHKEQLKRTGGSTGEPLEYYLDTKSVSQTWGFTLHCWNEIACHNPGDPYVTIAGDSLGSTHSSYKRRVYHFLQNAYHLNIDDLENNEFRMPKRFRDSKLLFGYPSMIYHTVKKNKGFRDYLPSLKAVFTTSEQLLPGVRSDIESILNVPVIDMYGANDGGLISCEDSRQNGFHYNCLNVFIEQEPSSGELLLTNLNSWTFPFVRYKVGDIAEKVEQPGGQADESLFPRIIGLKGRTRDIIRLPTGGVLHGSQFNKIFFCFPVIKQYRILQKKDFNLTITVLEADGVQADLEKIKIDIEELTAGELEIEIQTVAVFEQSEHKEKVIESLV